MRALSQQTGMPSTHDIRGVGRTLSLAGQAIAEELPSNQDGERIDKTNVTAPDKEFAKERSATDANRYSYPLSTVSSTILHSYRRARSRSLALLLGEYTDRLIQYGHSTV
ncbi:MAG: hypothetical protein Q9206_005360 [Seirophora lacunosa]